eukprot:2790294-Rhodomonas_salina.1
MAETEMAVVTGSENLAVVVAEAEIGVARFSKVVDDGRKGAGVEAKSSDVDETLTVDSGACVGPGVWVPVAPRD